MSRYAAEGHCPYCGQPFEKHDMHSVMDVIDCRGCQRVFVVRTHIDVSYTVHRVENEISRLREVA